MAEQPTDIEITKGQAHSPEHAGEHATVERLQAELDAKDQQIASRFKELAALASLLRAEQEKSERMRRELGWIATLLDRMVMRQPRLWSLLPAAKRHRRQREFMQRTGLFDAAAYLEIHPDVAESGGDPLQHYLLHGLHEGRSRTFHSDGEEGGHGG